MNFSSLLPEVQQYADLFSQVKTAYFWSLEKWVGEYKLNSNIITQLTLVFFHCTKWYRVL